MAAPLDAAGNTSHPAPPGSTAAAAANAAEGLTPATTAAAGVGAAGAAGGAAGPFAAAAGVAEGAVAGVWGADDAASFTTSYDSEMTRTESFLSDPAAVRVSGAVCACLRLVL